MSDPKVVTRFAPSPTGFMHVGGVRTALYAWLWARKNKGTFILRIEDTDKEREVSGSVEHIIESLRWLGIEWDEGPDIGGPHAPYLQSERLDSYKKYAQILIDKGFAYADPYTETEVQIFRDKSIAEGKPFLFRDYRPENPPVWDGSQPLRFKVTDIHQSKWNDLVRGELSAGPEALDDFILIKSDGYPTYNFAHIIDDLEMGVTHIMRADEFISSTPKFLSLYKALDITPPLFVTLPPIMGADGKKKLGKRDGAKDVLEYRNEGYLPEAMMNFLAFIGWNPGGEREIFKKEDLISEFDITKIQKSGGKFNEEKLDWFNREYMRMLSPEEQSAYLVKIYKGYLDPIEKKGLLQQVTPIVLERLNKITDIDTIIANDEFSYFYKDPIYEKENLIWKTETPENTKQYLEKLIELLTPLNDFSQDSIKTTIWPYAENTGKGNVLWPMRFALSGKDKSPDPFVLASILGKETTLERLEVALNKL